jgi:hypothetical protein
VLVRRQGFELRFLRACVGEILERENGFFFHFFFFWKLKGVWAGITVGIGGFGVGG